MNEGELCPELGNRDIVKQSWHWYEVRVTNFLARQDMTVKASAIFIDDFVESQKSGLSFSHFNNKYTFMISQVL